MGRKQRPDYGLAVVLFAGFLLNQGEVAGDTVLDRPSQDAADPI
jgi:hypothetical protein